MISRCNACKHGAVNLSKNYECWRFDREDPNDPFHTELREKHAKMYNKTDMCLYFEAAIDEKTEEAELRKKKAETIRFSQLVLSMMKTFKSKAH